MVTLPVTLGDNG